MRDQRPAPLDYYAVCRKLDRCDACERFRRLRLHFDCMAWFCRRCWRANVHLIGKGSRTVTATGTS